MSGVQILTVAQVAERVQLSAETVMRAIRAGDLEASQLTRARGGWRVREDAIATWLETRSNRTREVPLADVTPPRAGLPRRPAQRSTTPQTSGRLVA